jgi:hypothetical protein
MISERSEPQSGTWRIRLLRLSDGRAPSSFLSVSFGMMRFAILDVASLSFVRTDEEGEGGAGELDMSRLVNR